MEPPRYRYAPHAAILLAGVCLALVPLSASAQGKFSAGLRNAMNDVGDLITVGVERHQPRAEIRRLENSLWELSRVEHPGKAFGLSHNSHHHHHAHFTMGMRSKGFAMERELSDLRQLERSLRDLIGVLEKQANHRGRITDGVHHFGNRTTTTTKLLTPQESGKIATNTKSATRQSVKAFDPANLGKANGNLVGNRVAQKTAVAAPGAAKRGANNAGAKNGACAAKAGGGGAMQHHVKHGGGGQHQACAKQGNGNVGNAKANNGAKQNRAFAGKGGAPGNLIGNNNLAKAKAGGQGQQAFAKQGGAPGNLVGARAGNNVGGKAKASGVGQHQVKAGNVAQRACAKQGAGNFAGNKHAGKNPQNAAVAKNNGAARNVNPLAGNRGLNVGAKNKGAAQNVNPLAGNGAPNVGAKNGAGNVAAKHAGKGATPNSVAKNLGNRAANPANFMHAGASKHGAGQMHHQVAVRGNPFINSHAVKSAPMHIMPHVATGMHAMPHFTAGMHIMPHVAAAAHGHGNTNIGRRK